MSEVLSTLLAFPTVVYTGLLGLALLYWLFVIFGALDVDAFGAEGAADGVTGALKGADGVTGALKAAGTMDGAVEGVEGALEGTEAAKLGEASWLLHALNLRRAPITVVFSLIVFFGWVLSFTATRTLAPLLGAVLPEWLVGLVVLVASSAVALPLTSLATKPLEGVFKTREGKRRRDFVGAVCRISTGEVDGRYGQATVEDGGAGLIIQVRVDTEGGLKRGDRALIIDYDREREAYIVEAYDALVEEEASRAPKRRTARK